MSSVFEDGPLNVCIFPVTAAPKPLLLATPNARAEYPVILLQHGFSLRNSFYSQLMQHIASHGYILIAPQMYNLTGSNATEEISQAADIIKWIPGNLSKQMAHQCPGVVPNVEKFALMGHSRGGKVAFALALQPAGTLALKVSALVALDPVDGTGNGVQTQPPVLKFKSDSLDVGCSTMIVGSGLGTQRKNIFVPACAPEQVGHEAFFRDCCAPAFKFVAPYHGHMDFLDDETPGIIGRMSYYLCKSGFKRQPMRRATGGLVVAFLDCVFKQSDPGTFEAVVDGIIQQAPVCLDKVGLKN